MKHFLLIILCVSKLYAQDTLKLQLARYDERPAQLTEFMKRDSGIVILTCNSFDQETLNLINKYRIEKSLQPLKTSIRLDTLAYKEAFLMAKTMRFAHSSKFEEMKPYRDLIGAENIAYNLGLSSTGKLFLNTTPEMIVNGWIESLHHNENLLLKEAVVTATKSIVTIKFTSKGYVSWYAYFVYEADTELSLREQRKNGTKSWVPKYKHANN